jgi:hypothetical protein
VETVAPFYAVGGGLRRQDTPVQVQQARRMTERKASLGSEGQTSGWSQVIICQVVIAV